MSSNIAKRDLQTSSEPESAFAYGVEKLLTPEEAADILGVNMDYIKNHCTRQKPLIPHVKLGGGRYAIRRFKPSQLAQFIEQQTTLPRRVF